MSEFGGRRTRNFLQDHGTGVCVSNDRGYCPCPLEVADENVADLVCSDALVTDPLSGESIVAHLPVFDFDLPCRLLPSGTPGHWHLYLDGVHVAFDKYVAVLHAMAEAGIVQWGYHDATVERGFGSLRHPDRPKGGPRKPPVPAEVGSHTEITEWAVRFPDGDTDWLGSDEGLAREEMARLAEYAADPEMGDLYDGGVLLKRAVRKVTGEWEIP